MQQVLHNRSRLHSARRQRDGGYLLLAILLMMALMIIAATVVAPRIVQQIKRDREEEMIHRGTEYARAIKKFYKKNGRYPSNLDDLDKGQIRYLRKRFKDPLSKDGKWKLLNYGDIQTLLNTAGPGTPAASLSSQGGTISPGGAVVPGVPSPTPGSLSFGIQQQQQLAQQSQLPGSINGISAGSDQGSNPEGTPAFVSNNDTTNNLGNNQQGGFGNNQSGAFGNNQPGGFGSNQPGGLGNNQPGNNPQGGTTFGQNSAGGNQTFGGGAVVGVASLSKDPTIRIYNKKKTYNEWQFIYNPMMDQQNVLLRGPYQPITIGGGGIGTPAGQMNGQQQSPFGQQQNSFGQQPNGLGQQPSGFGQQPSIAPQPLQPGNTYPPDQNQPR